MTLHISKMAGIIFTKVRMIIVQDACMIYTSPRIVLTLAVLILTVLVLATRIEIEINRNIVRDPDERSQHVHLYFAAVGTKLCEAFDSLF